jgi:uncharacterized protein (DUF58 family)
MFDSPQFSTSLASPSLVRRAANLRLTAISLANSMRSGSFRSLYKGQGIEFCGVREYLRGDDVRAIDWNVTARMGKPFVKLFEEERELAVFLVVDCSRSVTSGAASKSRLKTVLETAALLALAAEFNGSPVGAALFDGEIRFSLAPKTGRDHVMLLLSRFDSIGAGRAAGTALDSALTGAAKLLRKRSLIFVVSDFRASLWETPLSVLAAKHDVVAIRIVDAFDEVLPPVGLIPFADPETLYKAQLPTSTAEFHREWQKANAQRTDKWFSDCTKNGALPLVISTDEDPGASLRSLFAKQTA